MFLSGSPRRRNELRLIKSFDKERPSKGEPWGLFRVQGLGEKSRGLQGPLPKQVDPTGQGSQPRGIRERSVMGRQAQLIAPVPGTSWGLATWLCREGREQGLSRVGGPSCSHRPLGKEGTYCRGPANHSLS